MQSSFINYNNDIDSDGESDYTPFSSRDHLLPLSSHAHSNSATTAEHRNLNKSNPMAWCTIRNDDWTGGFRHPSRAIHGGGKMSNKRRIALLKSYVPDWVICIVLAAVFFALDEIPGFKRQFSIEDTSIRFPYAVHERVPPVALYFIALVAPFVIQIVVNFITVRSLWDFHNSSLGLLLGLTLTGAITQFTKVTVGRPRPDVISRCQPPPGVTNPEYGLVTVEICRQTDMHILRDGFRSFPSGHSSLSFAGLGFLSFYLAGKMHLFDEKGHTTKAWISLTPLSAAALVAISRTMDYRHHWQDVLVGSLLGLVMSFFAYRQYYPPLSSPLSHKPYSPRIRREGSGSGAPGDDLMEVDDARHSVESHAPILPTTRPGIGMDSVRESRRNVHGFSGSGSRDPSGSGSRDSDGDRGRETVLTHPGVPRIHIVHGEHKRDSRGSMSDDGLTRYHDEQSTEELHQQPKTQHDAA